MLYFRYIPGYVRPVRVLENIIRLFPQSRNEKIIVLIVLVMVITAWTLDSILHPRIENSDLNNVAVMVAKDINPALFPTDFTFSEQSFYQAYTPVYRWIVKYLWQWTGNFEAGLVWLVPVVLGIFLVGMFMLLYSITGNTWLALGLTVASAHYHNVMGAEVWGIGGIQQIQARALFMAILPYVTLWFLFTVQHVSVIKVALLGFFVGLMANLHPGSGMHLSILLAGALILMYGFRRESIRIWSMIPLMAFTTLLGAGPIIANFTGNLGREVTEQIPFTLFSQAVGERYPLYFYPQVFKWYQFEITRPFLDALVWLYIGLAAVGFALYVWSCRQQRLTQSVWPRWAWLIGGLTTVGYTYMVALFEMDLLFLLVGLYIVYRFIVPYFKFLDWLMAGMMVIVILQSFVGYYLMTLAWDLFELQRITPVLIEQFRAARFVYLPIYILASLASVALVTELGILTNRMLAESRHALTLPSPMALDPVLSVLVGLVLSLLPGLSNNSPGWIYFLTIGALLAVILGIVSRFFTSAFSSGQLQYNPVFGRLTFAYLGLLLIIGGAIFGPLASLLAPVSPVPVVNLLNPTNRDPEPPWLESDSQLYQWARKNTNGDALFFWCGFGPSTTLRFRREAQRGITHNWKDLGWATYNGTTLVPLLDRYRKLERACHSMDQTLVAAYDVGADYIFMPTSKGIQLQAASCFVNERYIVFGLGVNACAQ